MLKKNKIVALSLAVLVGGAGLYFVFSNSGESHSALKGSIGGWESKPVTTPAPDLKKEYADCVKKEKPAVCMERLQARIQAMKNQEEYKVNKNAVTQHRAAQQQPQPAAYVPQNDQEPVAVAQQDLCPNIDGIQVVMPGGMILNSGVCVYAEVVSATSTPSSAIYRVPARLSLNIINNRLYVMFNESPDGVRYIDVSSVNPQSLLAVFDGITPVAGNYNAAEAMSMSADMIMGRSNNYPTSFTGNFVIDPTHTYTVIYNNTPDTEAIHAVLTPQDIARLAPQAVPVQAPQN